MRKSIIALVLFCFASVGFADSRLTSSQIAVAKRYYVRNGVEDDEGGGVESIRINPRKLKGDAIIKFATLTQRSEKRILDRWAPVAHSIYADGIQTLAISVWSHRGDSPILRIWVYSTEGTSLFSCTQRIDLITCR